MCALSINQDKPLVSIIIVTYNSAKFVLETLESAKAQSYQNIELIISDDGSQDQTLELCEKWLAANKERFVNSHIITVEQNTGIPANCNRGVKASKGEWIKLIAGDDILFPDAIENTLQCAIENNQKFVISDLQFFNEDGELNHYGSPKEIARFFSKKNVKEKYLSYLRSSVFLNSPTYFYHRSVYITTNGYDEDFKMLEDNPFIANTLKNNIDIIFLPKKTVYYRINSESATGSASSVILNDIRYFHFKYVNPRLKNGNFKDRMFYFKNDFEQFIKNRGWNRTVLFKIYYRLSAPIRKWS